MVEDKANINPQLPNAIADAQDAQTAATAQPTNSVSDQTGQFDTRFMLWRAFCAQRSVPVETLPSELTGEAKEAWEKIKDSALHKPVEGK